MTTSIMSKNVTIDSQYLHPELAVDRILSAPLSGYPELQTLADEHHTLYRLICNETGNQCIKTASRAY